jgi:hypothetical protein
LPALELKTEVFEPAAAGTLELIRTLVQEQTPLGEYCAAMFLFGDLGNFPYMMKRVRQEFKDHVMLISVPPIQQRGIVRGALYAGLYPDAVEVSLLEPALIQPSYPCSPAVSAPISSAPIPSPTAPLKSYGSTPPTWLDDSVVQYLPQDIDHFQQLQQHFLQRYTPQHLQQSTPQHLQQFTPQSMQQFTPQSMQQPRQQPLQQPRQQPLQQPRQQPRQSSTTNGYVPPPPTPITTSGGAVNQQIMRAPQTHTFSTPTLTPASMAQANSHVLQMYPLVMAFNFGNYLHYLYFLSSVRL